MKHQYIDTRGAVRTERLTMDGFIRFIYSSVREKNGFVFSRLTGKTACALLGYLNYDAPFSSTSQALRALEKCGVDMSESLDRDFKSVREIFERRIRYEECRPMSQYRRDVVSPADSKLLVGSFSEHSLLRIKEKFFGFEELLGEARTDLHEAFRDGDFCICRLTPDKYHFNHTPVSGIVKEIFTVDGAYHSCNPSAAVETVTPYSKNRRVVTVIDTDVEGGSRVGLVAMIEVVALMIGQIVQCYSEHGYDDPVDVVPELFVNKGNPKSMYRPGSSTDILIFQKGRIEFDPRLVQNRLRTNVESRYTIGFGQPICETEVLVRETIARRRPS